jgi:recombinational DNA repair ATPase RecF
LKDLATEIGEEWFSMVCDLVSVMGVSKLDQQPQKTLFALYTGTASYLGIKGSSVSVTTATSVPSADFLEQLSGYSNFKNLESTLQVDLTKRITLIFGANGSGKSSLCESLKVLASPEPPHRPLHNVRENATNITEFYYKFKSDAAKIAWNPSIGYGLKQETLKYFDAGIAITNVKSAVEPGRVIVLTPFKLHIFEWVTALTTQFRESLQREQQINSEDLTHALGLIRTEFQKFKGRPLATINEQTTDVLAEEIALGARFSEQKILAEKQTAAAEFEKALSEDGLKLLKAEYHELEMFLIAVRTLIDTVTDLWAAEPVMKSTKLAEKVAAQEVLAKALLPKNGKLEDLLTLLRAASPLCNLEAAADHECPLCKRELGDPEIRLFKQYHDLLSNEIEKEIGLLKVDISKAEELADIAKKVDRKIWDKSISLPEELLISAKTASDLIVASCDTTKDPTEEAKTSLESLKTLFENYSIQLQVKADAIEAATKSRDELQKQLEKLHSEIESLEYGQLIHLRLDYLKSTELMAINDAFWETNLPAFTSLLRKITGKAKKAHEDLVVSDFENRLNEEYKLLTEKDMAAFGVTLAKKGAEATMVMLPQVGGKDIENVLSEGEQRIHALALFFAELETCQQSVVVFDDPISSFDYNYISNYCTRIRDFSIAWPQTQIILLTHNWEFFVQIQTTLNKARLNGHLTVHVLENCAVVADYSEKSDDLKTDIEVVLNVPSESTRKEKEEIAGKMRRLIEAVINTHVFNKQRHQYKQKSQPVSEFQEFTKIVPLLPAEANDLGDLYSKLSITEHDDPRNAYVNTDKAMFQARYDKILAIETAVISRRQP